MLFKASAPGSLILLGEYAVLYDHYSLVCALDKRITVKLAPRNDQQIEIISALGMHKTELNQLEVVPPFKFVLATLKKWRAHFKTGCTLTIESEFSDRVGFASSAAVTVATLAAILMWIEFSYSPEQLVKEARDIIQAVQGLGSGADVSACVFGGMVAYRKHPLNIKKLSTVCPLTVIYSGYKTPTPEAIKKVTESFADNLSLFASLLQAIGQCAEQGIAAASTANWRELGKLMNVQQGLMDALGVNTPLLNKIIENLRADPAVFGAKISGSGLGDCVVAIGSASDNFCFPREAVAISNQGVSCEKI